MRFCSHLDVTRYMTRLIRKAGVPIWFTEGFNPRPYITFALPLSLGVTSDYEVMDIRLVDDSFDISSLPALLNTNCNEGIVFFKAAGPQQKVGALAFADYCVTFDDNGALAEDLREFIKRDSIIVLKKTKRGGEKQIDIKEHLKNAEIKEDNTGDTKLHFTLPAGGSLNINPELLIGAFLCEKAVPYTVNRAALRDADGNLFA